MAKDPAFLMYYKDILVSCADWDAEELGWYLRLLCHQADKPEGLQNDVEKLAVLCGVSFSSFEKFNSCWKRTLAANFEAGEGGLLFNKKLRETLDDRREFREKQSLRGIVGVFVKRARLENSLSDLQVKQLSKILFSTINTNNSKEENELCYKRTLAALLGNVNANGIVIGNKDKKEGGTGETIGAEMQRTFIYENSNYHFRESKDLPAIAEFAREITLSLGITTHWTELESHERKKVMDEWRKFSKIYSENWKNKQLDYLSMFKLTEVINTLKNGSNRKVTGTPVFAGTGGY